MAHRQTQSTGFDLRLLPRLREVGSGGLLCREEEHRWQLCPSEARQPLLQEPLLVVVAQPLLLVVGLAGLPC